MEERKFTKEEVKKAIEQADANLDFEEIALESINEMKKQKILRKDLNEGRRR